MGRCHGGLARAAHQPARSSCSWVKAKLRQPGIRPPVTIGGRPDCRRRDEVIVAASWGLVLRVVSRDQTTLGPTAKERLPSSSGERATSSARAGASYVRRRPRAVIQGTAPPASMDPAADSGKASDGTKPKGHRGLRHQQARNRGVGRATQSSRTPRLGKLPAEC